MGKGVGIRVIQTAGTYNGVGPSLESVSMAQLLYGCRAITNSKVSFTWIPEEFLAQHEIQRYPLYFSPNGTFRGAARVSSRRSFAAGLRHRPIAVTAIDTLEWFKQQPTEFRDGLRLNLERDQRALEA